MYENKNAELRGLIMWQVWWKVLYIMYNKYIVDELYDFYFTFICINYEGTTRKEFSLLGTVYVQQKIHLNTWYSKIHEEYPMKNDSYGIKSFFY